MRTIGVIKARIHHLSVCPEVVVLLARARATVQLRHVVAHRCRLAPQLPVRIVSDAPAPWRQRTPVASAKIWVLPARRSSSGWWRTTIATRTWWEASSRATAEGRMPLWWRLSTKTLLTWPPWERRSWRWRTSHRWNPLLARAGSQSCRSLLTSRRAQETRKGWAGQISCERTLWPKTTSSQARGRWHAAWEAKGGRRLAGRRIAEWVRCVAIWLEPHRSAVSNSVDLVGRSHLGSGQFCDRTARLLANRRWQGWRWLAPGPRGRRCLPGCELRCRDQWQLPPRSLRKPRRRCTAIIPRRIKSPWSHRSATTQSERCGASPAYETPPPTLNPFTNLDWDLCVSPLSRPNHVQEQTQNDGQSDPACRRKVAEEVPQATGQRSRHQDETSAHGGEMSPNNGAEERH